MTKDPGDYGLSCDQFVRRVALFLILVVALVFASAADCGGDKKRWCHDDHGRRVACPTDYDGEWQ